jgi:hypothetical protein
LYIKGHTTAFLFPFCVQYLICFFFLLFRQGCLKLSADFGGANIYVEQHRTLKLLHSGSSSLLRPDGKRHCFDSHKGQVALFLESDSLGGGGGGSDPLRRETAAFDYDLQLVEEGGDQQQSLDPWQGTR